MPPLRATQPHDPFTDAPLRTNHSHATTASSSTTLRSAIPSQHSFRTAPSFRTSAATSSRSRPDHPHLLAPTLSRRPPSRLTPNVVSDHELHEDPESENEDVREYTQRTRATRAPSAAESRYAAQHTRRAGSPDVRHARLRAQKSSFEQLDIVNRQSDGSYLLGLLGEGHIGGAAVGGLPGVSALGMEELEEAEKEREYDDHCAAVARQYFTSGAALGGSRSSRKHEEDYEEAVGPMAIRLRAQAMEKIQDDKWMYEATDPYHARFA